MNEWKDELKERWMNIKEWLIDWLNGWLIDWLGKCAEVYSSEH